MKRFAYKFEDSKYIMTNVWEVKRGKKNEPRKWEGMKFFSTHKRLENRKELVFVDRKPNAYFKYKNLDNFDSHEGHEITLTHELCKEILSEFDVINFKIGNEYYKIYVSECEIEQKIEIGDSYYFVDLFIKFEKSEPEWLVVKWNGIVAVEIFVSHETKGVKRKDLFNSGIPIIEVPVSEKFYIKEDREITEEEIVQKKKFISDYYKSVVFAKIIANPSSKEYLNMIEKLESRIPSLENQIVSLKNEQQQKAFQTNKLNEENSYLKRLIIDKDRELSTLKSEYSEIKKSFWYRFFNKKRK